MSDATRGAISSVRLGASIWEVARSDPKWLARYIVLFVVELLILMFWLVVFLADSISPGVVLSSFVLAPVFVLIGVYLGMSPGYFFARQSIAAIENSLKGVEVWSLSALPLNVDTTRKWAKEGAPRASLVRPSFIAFGQDSMSVWIRCGMLISQVVDTPRDGVTLVRVIQNGTRPVINLGLTVDQTNQMALVATKGALSFSPAYLMKGADFVASWVHGRKSPSKETTNRP
jgi:hypothetical protein